MMVRKVMLLAGALGFVALSVQAQSYTTPLKPATIFKTSFVRATDACTDSNPTVHIAESGLPSFGCLANDTDALAFGKAIFVLHKAHGKYVLTGNGFTPGDEVHLVLNLQITRKNTTTGQGNKDVTLPPVEAECPSVTANPKGVILLMGFSDGCTVLTQKAVDPTPGPEGGTDSKTAAINIQVLGVSLVNDATGNVFATAG